MFGIRSVFFMLVLLVLSNSLLAQKEERGTPDEAKAMAIRAADTIRSDGLEKALRTFDDPKNETFHHQDLYVFVLDENGNTLAGAPQIRREDLANQPYTKQMIAMKEPGWITYGFINPEDHKKETKRSFVLHVGNLHALKHRAQ